MTAPSPASSAQPGWRGTDPYGGTWVLTADADDDRWIYVDGHGQWDLDPRGIMWRTQEEAEAAVLEALQAESAWDIRHEVESWLLAEARWELSQVAARFDEMNELYLACDTERADAIGKMYAAERAAAPAPLDPGNPEHLRQVADLITALAVTLDWEHPNDMKITPLWLREKADLLDREQREAKQDAADRKRAEEIAREQTESDPLFDPTRSWEDVAQHTRDRRIALALAGIRAGRAERQEQGQ